MVQDLILRPHVVRSRRQRWLSRDGRMVTAPSPAGIAGHFGAELRRFVLAQYHRGQVTVPRLTGLLCDIGVDISERQVVRLLNGRQRQAIERIRARVWWFYADLKAYCRDPTPRHKAALKRRFESIFSTETGFATLDRLLERLRANKDELLLALERPDIPLHTNGSETTSVAR